MTDLSNVTPSPGTSHTTTRPITDQRVQVRALIDRLLAETYERAHDDELTFAAHFFRAFNYELREGELDPGVMVHVLYGHLHDAPALQYFRSRSTPPRYSRGRVVVRGETRTTTTSSTTTSNADAGSDARGRVHVRLWLDEIQINGRPLRNVTGGEVRQWATHRDTVNRFACLVAEQVPDDRKIGEIVNDAHAADCARIVFGDAA